MKSKFYSFLLLFFVLTATASYAQTISQTKAYIIDKIIVNPWDSQVMEAVFLDKLTIDQSKQLTGKILEEDEKERILSNNQIVEDLGKQIFAVMYSFDVKGINSVTLSSQIHPKTGEKLNSLIISINESYLSVTKHKVFGGGNTYDRRDTIEIPLKLNEAELKLLKKAFLHLCKLYGGNPIKEDLF
ncbi:hypothetical protein [Pontibacter vulgaris]|uniref:hypothetical protein n=1 Tax=Pontibacter vulgaris TaxID=2905679 RepID=UPI001FA787D8|nr:hypothetical protein [Pontibacter vulgaris]